MSKSFSRKSRKRRFQDDQNQKDLKEFHLAKSELRRAEVTAKMRAIRQE